MTQPIYYLPGLTKEGLCDDHRKLRRSVLEARGLLGIFADVYSVGDDCGYCDINGIGPDGKSGLILHYRNSKGHIPKHTHYDPAVQEWRPIGDGSLAWIGIDTSSPPTPDDYRRKRVHQGYEVETSIGTIVVPIIRRPDNSTELPTDYEWDAAGNVQMPIKQAYRKHWEDMSEVVDWLFSEDGTGSSRWNMARALELCVQAVGINYRFGRAEQMASKVVDSDNLFTIMGATVDLPKVARVLESNSKKNSTQSTSSSTAGDLAGSPTTDQV